jgi:hypothetical protein
VTKKITSDLKSDITYSKWLSTRNILQPTGSVWWLVQTWWVIMWFYTFVVDWFIPHLCCSMPVKHKVCTHQEHNKQTDTHTNRHFTVT